jgi:predicted ATPase
MINSLRIRHFRCFEDISLEGLGTINVLVGDNGSGKTALLESLFLSQVGHPEVVTRLRLWRSLGGTLALTRTRGAYEAIWKDLFSKMRDDQPIEILARGTPENNRSLKIYYDPSESLTIPISSKDHNGSPTGQKTDSSTIIPQASLSGQNADSSTIIPLIFELTDGNAQKHTFKPTFGFEGLSFGGIPPAALAAFYSSSFAAVTPPQEIVTQFSDLSKNKKTRPFIKTITTLYPHIRDLSVETELGVSMLFCEVKGLPTKVPVSIVSGGTHKLISILLGISSQPKGVVLIDELENGFYYKTLPKVWEALLAFCKAYSVQVFASTHSKECLVAALPALQGHEDRFRLIRAEKKVGQSILRVYKGDEFEAAIETKTEVR